MFFQEYQQQSSGSHRWIKALCPQAFRLLGFYWVHGNLKWGASVFVSALMVGWYTTKWTYGIWSHLQNGEIFEPPPHRCSDSQTWPVVFSCAICCLSKSQIRLDEVLHGEIILVWHSFFLLSGFFVLRLSGFLGWRDTRDESWRRSGWETSALFLRPVEGAEWFSIWIICGKQKQISSLFPRYKASTGFSLLTTSYLCPKRLL